MIHTSLIIPTFKRIDQTLHTIDLIRASKGFGDIFDCEIIVTDSTPDDSLQQAIQKKFGTQIIYTKPEKPGVATNKNQGARIATHPMIIFCDSDMEVEPETLRNTIQALKDHDTGAMVGGQVIWKNGPHDGTIDRPRTEDRIEKRNATFYIEALYSRFIATYKDAFLAVGGYDETAFNMRGEGSDLSVRFWRAGYPLIYNETIRVHHVHDAPDSVALRVNHPEWGIAKDLFLLMYKYSMFDGEYMNFAKTVCASFTSQGQDGYFRLLQGIGKHMDLISEVKAHLDEFRASTPVYDFKFLEVFTDQKLFDTCLSKAQNLLLPIRTKG